MKTSTLTPSDNDVQFEEKWLRTAKFQCHGVYVIGFNALLAVAIYGALMLLR